MATKKKMLQAAAGNAGGAGLNVEDVFSTYLYTGTGDNQTNTVTNGLDLAGEGGMVWTKGRDIGYNPIIFDSERGLETFLYTNGTSAQENQDARSNMSFNSDGYSFGSASATSWGPINEGTYNFASWTFRKASKFFDVVTWTGDGVAGRTIAHNIGSAPGMILVKDLGDPDNSWNVYHRAASGTPQNSHLELDNSNAVDNSGNRWNNTSPTSAVFSVGNSDKVNASGHTYVAYLFAHNDGDGDFGADGDADIIKCGSYTGGTTGTEVNVGFEPQFVMIKRAVGGTGDWMMFDAMRGVVSDPYPNLDNTLFANLSNAERTNTGYIGFTPTGFIHQGGSGDTNTNGDTYIYMAIRRGTKVPESATEVFAIHNQAGSYSSPTNVGFPVDLSIMAKRTGNSLNSTVGDRLRGSTKFLSTSLTSADDTGIDWQFDLQNNFQSTWTNDTISWMWKRAPGYFDAVAYTGDSNAGRTVSHNLGVVPEMIWVKSRVYTFGFMVRVNNDFYGYMNSTGASFSNHYADMWNSTDPTSTEITLGTFSAVNASGNPYIAYLFASLPGISKVGSYTGNGGTQTIDCGFTSGARFVLIKRTDSSGSWFVWDAERGIVSGNEPYLTLNQTAAEDSGSDTVDPNSSGFTVNETNYLNQNTSGASYIFYAIA